jgi:Kelch motif protein
VWASKAPIPTPRSGLGVAGAGGFIYAVGGSGNGVRATVERYDPVNDRWVPRAPLSVARALLAVGAVDGILYAIGGSTVNASFLATNEAYQP